MTRQLVIAGALLAALASPALAGTNPIGPSIRTGDRISANRTGTALPGRVGAMVWSNPVDRFGFHPWVPKISSTAVTKLSTPVVFRKPSTPVIFVKGSNPAGGHGSVPRCSPDAAAGLGLCDGPVQDNTSRYVGVPVSAIARLRYLPQAAIFRRLDPPAAVSSSRAQGHAFGLYLQLGKASPQVFGTVNP